LIKWKRSSWRAGIFPNISKLLLVGRNGKNSLPVGRDGKDLQKKQKQNVQKKERKCGKNGSLLLLPGRIEL